MRLIGVKLGPSH